ncbi:MAG: hypothetical protein KGP14_01845 [Betaproteobacteria bacterium]|nr:hypothetical protein [Betaproteobacteria bacterium]
MPDPLALTMNQNIGKQGPALSATSDMPVAAPAEPAAPAAPADPKDDATPPAPADPAPSADPKPAADDPHGDDGKGDDKTPPWMKAEITKERNRRREAEQKANEAQARLDQALKALEQSTGKPAKTASDQIDDNDPRPSREQFEDPAAYDDALIEWSSRRASATALADAESKRVQESVQQQQEVMRKGWEGRREKAIAEMPDYAEVAESPDVQISMPMAHAIITAPNGPQIAYHLGKNPEIAARIASLPPAQAVFEMGLLAASLKVPAPEFSKAPEPPKPIGSRADATPKGPEEESMEEYAARRKKELRTGTR